MTRIFAITTASDRITTGGDGRGEITFTVTNSSPRSLRGQLRVRPLGSTQREWLNIAGEIERNFSPNTTQQVIVRITTPPGTPAGRYQFRLDTVSLLNPDDDFTEGPTVDLEIKATAAPKKPFPWWIIAAAAGGLVLIVALTWFFWPSGIEVPDAVGLDVGEATKKFEAARFKVEVKQQSNATVAVNHVFAQEPEAKSKAKEGAVVTLLVSAQTAPGPAPKPAEQRPVGPSVVFEDNFDNGLKPGWSQTRTDLTPNGRTRFLGQFYNDQIALRVNDLPVHKTITATFDLYVINSWDGDLSPTDAPDFWVLKLESSPDSVFTTFSNQDGGRQRFACRPGEEAAACQSSSVPATTGALAINSLGFNTMPGLRIKDCIYRIKRVFRHDQNYLNFYFYGQLKEGIPGNQNVGNESWGIDNVRIEAQ